MEHLHLHTEGSSLDGLGRTEDLILHAKKSGSKVLAITDHGTLSNIVRFQNACQKHDMLWVFGMEIYFKHETWNGHLTVLCRGQEGFNNLVKLHNLSQVRVGKFLVFDDLLAYREGLVVLSGCPASPLQRLNKAEAIELARRFKEAFVDNFYIETMLNPEMPETFQRSMLLADALNTTCVLTNDVHYALAEDSDLHNILTNINADYSYSSKSNYLTSDDDIYERASTMNIARETINELLANTKKLATSLANETITIQAKAKLPHFTEGNEKLRKLVCEGVIARGFSDISELGEQAKERLEYELSVIEKLGFESYFLVLQDIAAFCEDKKICMGYGRGSGVASLVLYLLKVTNINPLVFNLSFERFLNSIRKEPPDVDLDFASNRRGEVVKWMQVKYNAMQVATNSYFHHASLARELCRYYKIDKSTTAQLAAGEQLDSALIPASVKSQFLRAYYLMLNQQRHKSRHAGGVVIINKEDVVPYTILEGEKVIVWSEGSERELSQAGFVKFDLLGIEALNIVAELREYEMIKDFNDIKTIEAFRAGNTKGVFQFSGAGFTQFTIEAQPRTFEDLIAINALYRAANTKQRDNYTKQTRMFNIKEIDEILAPTRGYIVYQEQVMSLVALVTGGDLEQADLARRLISKPKLNDSDYVAKFMSLKDKFLASSLPQPIIKTLWDDIVEHSGYSFNKSHATAYAALAFEMMYHKVHYPERFTLACLNQDRNNTQAHILQAILLGFEFELPSANSSADFVLKNDKTISCPLWVIKGLSYETAKAIEYIRAERDFTDKKDFVERCGKRIARKNIVALIEKIGGFDRSLMLFVLGEKELDTSVLDVLIPARGFMKRMEKENERGLGYALVAGIEERDKGKGTYYVYNLFPDRKAWASSKHEIGSEISFLQGERGRIVVLSEVKNAR